MNDELLSIKYRIPLKLPGLIIRDRLTETISTGITSGPVLVSAPAGFGKTSLLREWTGDAGCPVAWISLDNGDNDPVRFLRYLAAGISKALPEAEKDIDAITGMLQPGSGDYKAILTMLVNRLSERDYNLQIVLDDYHVIENMAVHSLVSFLVEHTIPYVRMIIATRNDPPLPLARWRARGNLTELRSSDLRFRPEEIEAYLQDALGMELPSSDISLLDEKTEGWAAGLKMMVLSMKDRDDYSGYIRAFSGSHRYIMDYLVEEVLAHQTESIQQFLLRTSILDTITGDLCNALTGGNDGAEILETIDKAGLFLIPLDDERRWYRYHHLFADLLRARLRELFPDQIDTLRRQAALWYEKNGFSMEAVTQLEKVSDMSGVADLAENMIIPLITRGELATVLRWYEILPENVLSGYPYLGVFIGLALVFAGRTDAIDHLLLLAERGIDSGDLSARTDDIRGSIAAIRAYMADLQGDAASAIALAEEAENLLSQSNIIMHSALPFIQTRAYRLEGDLVQAEDRIHKVIDLARSAGNILMLANACYEQAAIRKIEGKLNETAGIYLDTIRTAEANGIRQFGTMVKIEAGMADVLNEQNKIDKIEVLAEDLLQRLATWNNPTDHVITCLALASVYRGESRFAEASDVLDTAEGYRRRFPLFPPLGTMIGIERVRLFLCRDDLTSAERWVEDNRDVSGYPVLIRELIQITQSRVMLAAGKTGEAFEILLPLAEEAEKGKRFGRLIEILALLSMAYMRQKNEAKALDTFEKAVYYAQPEGYVRVFTAEGALMKQLLHMRGKRAVDTPAVTAYLQQVSNTFEFPGQQDQKPIQGLLTERETEVLSLIAKGMTNKQIASELYISAGTVKAHTASIYRKLDAMNRTQAIDVARKMNLLS